MLAKHGWARHVAVSPLPLAKQWQSLFHQSNWRYVGMQRCRRVGAAGPCWFRQYHWRNMHVSPLFKPYLVPALVHLCVKIFFAFPILLKVGADLPFKYQLVAKPLVVVAKHVMYFLCCCYLIFFRIIEMYGIFILHYYYV